jgi:hypothetical protein
VGESGQAIQSGRDTIIQNGLSSEQLGQIISTIAAQVPAYTVIAREVVDERLQNFKDEILKRFEADQSARAEAFRDPDFQYVFHDAQNAFARSGEENVGAILVDLIAERSKSPQRDRMTLSLNQAVEVAANLTVNEFAALALSYRLRHTRMRDVISVASAAATLNDKVNPFIDNISREQSAFSYLVALRCATISTGSITLRDVLVRTYPAVFMRGELLERYGPSWAELQSANLLIPSLHDHSRFQPNAIDKTVWNDVAGRAGFGQALIDSTWSVAEGTLMQQDEITAAYAPLVPRIADAFEVWDNTPLKSLELTTVGIAIAHAYCKSSGFEADLRIWIK